MRLAHPLCTMTLSTFVNRHLGHRSYLLGSTATREATVIDPERHIDEYISVATQAGLTITTVIDTHLHADYVSGARALARRTGALLCVSGCGGPNQQYDFASERGVRSLHAGDTIAVGELRIEARHTPAHAPEHLSLLVTDPRAGQTPVGVFTGDSAWPQADGLPLWPAHTPDASDMACDRPRYFAEIARINRRGAHAWRQRRHWPPVALRELAGLIASCALFVDLRPDAGASGFLPGSVLLAMDDSFVVRAGSVLRYGMPIYVVSASEEEVANAAALLSLIGLDHVYGWVSASAVPAYAGGGGVLEYVRMTTPRDAVDLLVDGALLLDVRSTVEWNTRHLKHALHTPLSHVIDDVRDVDRDTPLVVYSEEGVRSVVAATALRRAGFSSVANLTGGFHAYQHESRA